MNPGRELDALVAEKVMGWKREGKNSWLRPEHRPSKDFPGKIINDWDSKGEHDFLISPDGEIKVAFCGCDTYGDIPGYSTDIAAAWEVVEKLKWAEPELSWNDEQHCWCLYLPKARQPEEGVPSSETAPHAICRAALKAVGEK